ncbi:MAG: tetratricopeptide repeat protein [Pseudomonadota bacterium]
MVAVAACVAALAPLELLALDVPKAQLEFIALTEQDLAAAAGTSYAVEQDALFASTELEQRLDLAKRLVAIAFEGFGDSHRYTAIALTNLATVQYESGEFPAAAENYEAAVARHEKADGTLVSEDLINALLGVASTAVVLGEYDDVIAAYERAIHVSHVNLGPSNLEQAAYVDALSRTHYAADDFKTALALQDKVARLYERQFDRDPDSLEGKDQWFTALEQRAKWYAEGGDLNRSFIAYRRLERTLAKAYGKHDPRLITPIMARAQIIAIALDSPSQRRRQTSVERTQKIANWERACMRGECPGGFIAYQQRAVAQPWNEPLGANSETLRQGRSAVAKALRIARKNPDDPGLLANTLVKKGDWLTLINEYSRARRAYKQAWSLLDETPDLHDLRDKLFAQPTLIARSAQVPVDLFGPSTAVPKSDAEQSASAQVLFDLDYRGRPKEVKVVSVTPKNAIDRNILRGLKRFRFRPAIIEGVPQPATAVPYEHTYIIKAR